MTFTDIFIRRPVLATVISLLILLLGGRSLFLLNVREYPETSNAIITVMTPYVGADADLVKGFITTPLEREIASADGIDYLDSSSMQGVSVIQAHLNLDYDPYKALTQITANVNKVKNELPEESEEPVLDVTIGESTASMYMSFSSDVLEPNQVTDYLIRVVQPQLQAISGIQQAEILGARTFAMRIWLDPEKMAAVGITPGMVRRKLAENNFLAAVGSTKGAMVAVSMRATTNLHTRDEFRNLVIAESGGTITRLAEIAEVDLGAEDYESRVSFDGTSATFMGITVLPTANALDVIDRVRQVVPDIRNQLPEGLEMAIPYDATLYIHDAIFEVERTIVEALLIVVVVIFLFLGSVRSVLIPAVTIPLSIVGAGFLMLLFGFTVNLLTLLAMVLAIGLVVDDAIVMMENIHRHIEEGSPPFKAAIAGARELAVPVLAMTTTLIAVYAPIGFMGGLTGSLFTEFAFTLAGAVFISGIVALTLSPMMCSKILKPSQGNNRLVRRLEAFFDRLKSGYRRSLHRTLDYLPVILVFATVVLVSCYFLYDLSSKELAPTEDRGILLVSATSAPYASIDMTELYSRQVYESLASFPETEHVFMVAGRGPGGAATTGNTVFAGQVFKTWSQRERSQMEVKSLTQEKVHMIAGLESVVFDVPPLPGGGEGLPVQFVIGTTDEPIEIDRISREMLKRARESGLFVFADTDLKYDLPQVEIIIDREKAADLGLTMEQVGVELATMMSANYVNRFSIQGRSYKVIPQVQRNFRLNPEQLKQYYVRSADGRMVPLSTIIDLDWTVEPEQLKRFQQLNAAIISGVPSPGVSMGEALGFLQQQADDLFPKGYQANYAGQSRQYVQEGSALVVTFFLAIVVIFLVLAAQFESFRDPLIILISVPMSIAGALAASTIGLITINIYTQVGLITLIGLISKHGILIVEFANELQRSGKSKREAVEEAAAIRLRPILMTTAATVMGVFPLVIATGPGSVSRFNIGLVIITGMTIGTLFTLFVVPSFYMLLAKVHRPEEGVEAA